MCSHSFLCLIPNTLRKCIEDNGCTLSRIGRRWHIQNPITLISTFGTRKGPDISNLWIVGIVITSGRCVPTWCIHASVRILQIIKDLSSSKYIGICVSPAAESSWAWARCTGLGCWECICPACCHCNALDKITIVILSLNDDTGVSVIKVVLIETHLFWGGGRGGRRGWFRGFHIRAMTMMAIRSLGTIGASLVIGVSVSAIRLSGLIRRGLWCRIGTMVPRRWPVPITSGGEGGKGDEKEKESEDSHCWNIPADTRGIKLIPLSIIIFIVIY